MALKTQKRSNKVYIYLPEKEQEQLLKLAKNHYYPSLSSYLFAIISSYLSTLSEDEMDEQLNFFNQKRK